MLRQPSEERQQAAEKIRALCLVGLQPSEYDGLTDLERELLNRELDELIARQTTHR